MYVISFKSHFKRLNLNRFSKERVFFGLICFCTSRQRVEKLGKYLNVGTSLSLDGL